MDREAWRATVHGAAKKWIRPKRLSTQFPTYFLSNSLKKKTQKTFALDKKATVFLLRSSSTPVLKITPPTRIEPCFTKPFLNEDYKWTTVQFSSVAQSCPTLCNPMNRSTPGLPVHHQLPEFTQTHIRRVSDAIQPSHPLSSPSPPTRNPSQHQSLFQ